MANFYNFERMNVLVIDDNKHMRAIISTVLQGFGIRNIHNASDPASAFEDLRTRPTDLIICEYQLSPIDGLEFVKMVRTAEDSRDPLIPILMLTAHSELEHVMSARDAGITEFVTKPVSPSVLYKHIVMIVENPRQFVRSEKFFGPDRRRRSTSVPEGEDRRNREDLDPIDSEKVSAD